MPLQVSVVERTGSLASVPRRPASDAHLSPFSPREGRVEDGGATGNRPRTATIAVGRWSATFRLLAICTGIAAVWLVMLPWLAARPGIAARLNELEAQGIDPSAMFYSELPAMDDVQLRLDRARRDDPLAFWRLP